MSLVLYLKSLGPEQVPSPEYSPDTGELYLDHWLCLQVVVCLEVEPPGGQQDPAGVEHQRRDLVPHGLHDDVLLEVVYPGGVEGEPGLPGVHDGGDHPVLFHGGQAASPVQLLDLVQQV